MIALINPDTAAAFEALTDFDQFVHIPARQGQGTCYRGMISGITPEGAERYVRFGGNLIGRKAAPAPAIVAEEIPAEENIQEEDEITEDINDDAEEIPKKTKSNKWR